MRHLYASLDLNELIVPSLTGRVHTQDDPWILLCLFSYGHKSQNTVASHEFVHILQGCFTDTGVIPRMKDM